MRTWFYPQDGWQVQFSVLFHGDWYSNVHGMTIDGHSISGPTLLCDSDASHLCSIFKAFSKSLLANSLVYFLFLFICDVSRHVLMPVHICLSTSIVTPSLSYSVPCTLHKTLIERFTLSLYNRRWLWRVNSVTPSYLLQINTSPPHHHVNSYRSITIWSRHDSYPNWHAPALKKQYFASDLNFPLSVHHLQIHHAIVSKLTCTHFKLSPFTQFLTHCTNSQKGLLFVHWQTTCH